MSDPHSDNKARLAPYRTALKDGALDAARAIAGDLFTADAIVHMCHPFGDQAGAGAFHDTCLAPLHAALPDLERRDWIVMAGRTAQGGDWVGCGGHYVGTFAAPFLGISPTGQVAHMRFHEFYRFEGGKVVEMQAIWDIPELMMQARIWPMAPSLGCEMMVPGPATQDGLVAGPWDAADSQASCDLVVDMLAHMIRHPSQGGPEVMEMDRFWHPAFTWYGPAGIGTARGVDGFRRHHQIPFLRAMPDRGQYEDEIEHHFFGDGAYAAVTGWPNMAQTLTGGGWLGLPGTGQKVTLRSLDFWRTEDGLIRENWVLVDLLDLFAQLGIDVFERMRERVASPIAEVA